MTPLVFVHGFLGGSRQWKSQCETFADDFEVITCDLPGYGENAQIDAPDSIAKFAAWVLDHLSDRNIDQFHLVGHSMGGMVAQEMVRAAPSRISRLVLYGTGPTGALPGRFEPIGTSIRRACSDGARNTARRIAATWFLHPETTDAFEDCAALAECSSLQAILAGLEAMQNWDGTRYLSDIKARTLILWGDGDRTYDWQQAETLWKSIPDTSLAVIPRCAHAVHLEKPKLFNDMLRDFLHPKTGTKPSDNRLEHRESTTA